MNMKDKRFGYVNIEETPSREKRLSPIELIRLHGGRAHKVGGMTARGADAMLAVFNERFTYTFIMNKEVASIHFDRSSNKIYFSGHNIQNLTLTGDQRRELLNVVSILEEDADGKELKSAYEATLTSLLADNR